MRSFLLTRRILASAWHPYLPIRLGDTLHSLDLAANGLDQALTVG